MGQSDRPDFPHRAEDFRTPGGKRSQAGYNPELIRLLYSPNRERREHARRLLAVRPEEIASKLRQIVENHDEASLEAFWVLNLRTELDETQCRAALRHRNEHVRRWAVRLLGDRNSVSGAAVAELSTLAQTETAVEVRSQLASTAKRLPTGQAFPIIRQLLTHDADAGDKHIPLLIWWAIESKANTGREELIALVRDPAVWKTKIFATHSRVLPSYFVRDLSRALRIFMSISAATTVARAFASRTSAWRSSRLVRNSSSSAAECRVWDERE